MKKIFLGFITLILTIGMFSQARPLSIQAAGHDSLNIIKDVNLERKVGTNPVEVIGNDTIVSVYDMIIVNYEFKLDDSINYQNKTTEFTLPSIFDANKTVTNLDIIQNGELIAQLVRTPGTLDMKLTFTDNSFLVNNSNITGTIRIFTQFDEAQITTQQKYPIEFNGLSTIDVEVMPPGEGVKPEHAYVWKGGTLQPDNQTILWEIYISAFTDLTDVVMNDTHTEGQEIVPESFVVDKTTHFDASGNAHYSGAPELVPVFNGFDGFTLNVGTLYYDGTSAEGNPISTVEHNDKHDLIRVRYLTRITEKKDTYFNNVSITASQLGSEIRDMESFVTGGSGIIVGESRAVILRKIDADTQQGIAGALFKLEKLNQATNTWNTYKDNLDVNDVNGIKIENLTFGTYRFVETKAPDGYILNDTPQPSFVIDVSTATSALETYTYENTRASGSLKIVKIASHDQTYLSDAVFELRDKNSSVIYSITATNQNGIATLDGIAFGDYELYEVKAPTGYQVLGYVKDVTINESMASHEIHVENDILKGSVQLKKSDTLGNPLSGAIFKLQTHDGIDFKII